MDLTGRLRQRSEQSKAIAQVDCGDLGVLTVQGLPLRECEALAAGPDGDRALFYAACRQLQSAGEQLRREGRLFRPDEIMQLVSDEEARTGAQAVGRLSGWDIGTDGGTEAQEEEKEEDAEEKAAPSAQEEGPAEGEIVKTHEETSFPKMPDSITQYDKILPPFVQDSLPSEPDKGLVFGKQTVKVRLQPVQNSGNQSSKIKYAVGRETQVGQVSRESAEESDRVVSCDNGQSGQKIQESPAKERSIDSEKPALQMQKQEKHHPKPSGRVKTESRREGRQPPEQSQAREAVFHRKALRGIPAESPAIQGECLHKNKFERGEEMHETGAEFPAPERENLHEIKSELPAQTGEGLHETKSEFPAQTGEGLHEIKSELPAQTGEGLHEIKSEFPAQTGEGLHEIKSERSPRREDGARPLTPVTEDLAREVARVMVEGLRRAAGAR